MMVSFHSSFSLGDGAAVGVLVRLLASHQSEMGPIAGGVAPGSSHVGIVPDDAAGRRVILGISRFPRPCVPALLPRFTLIGSQDLAVKSRPNLFTHSSGDAQVHLLASSNYSLWRFRGDVPVAVKHALLVGQGGGDSVREEKRRIEYIRVEGRPCVTDFDLQRRNANPTTEAENPFTSRYSTFPCSLLAVAAMHRDFDLQAKLYNVMDKYSDVNCALVACFQSRGRRLGHLSPGGVKYRVGQWLKRTGLDSRWGRSRIFAFGNRAGRCRWYTGFLGDLTFPPLLHSGAVPYSSRFTLIGSRDLGVKSRINLSAPLDSNWIYSGKLFCQLFLFCRNVAVANIAVDLKRFCEVSAARPGFGSELMIDNSQNHGRCYFRVNHLPAQSPAPGSLSRVLQSSVLAKNTGLIRLDSYSRLYRCCRCQLCIGCLLSRWKATIGPAFSRRRQTPCVPMAKVIQTHVFRSPACPKTNLLIPQFSRTGVITKIDKIKESSIARAKNSSQMFVEYSVSRGKTVYHFTGRHVVPKRVLVCLAGVTVLGAEVGQTVVLACPERALADASRSPTLAAPLFRGSEESRDGAREGVSIADMKCRHFSSPYAGKSEREGGLCMRRACQGSRDPFPYFPAYHPPPLQPPCISELPRRSRFRKPLSVDAETRLPRALQIKADSWTEFSPTVGCSRGIGSCSTCPWLGVEGELVVAQPASFRAGTDVWSGGRDGFVIPKRHLLSSLAPARFSVRRFEIHLCSTGRIFFVNVDINVYIAGCQLIDIEI
ncbi:hypothetical protein PR048_014854 [Dryococelus australis]|uniref:Uncharacterized protein n=1 Tax=Dryococelus australis TaxID=614101 RepID=A0ABQ9HFK0_9NEOP|nr:hypothetical protein PR048_014854 [Dryococelus australis]